MIDDILSQMLQRDFRVLKDMLEPGHKGDDGALGIMSIRMVLISIGAIVLSVGYNYGRGG